MNDLGSGSPPANASTSESPSRLAAANPIRIGGSEIHEVMNLEPYGCCHRKWLLDRGQKPDYEPTFNPHLARGTKGEALIAKEYALATKRKLRNIRQEMAHPQHPEFRGHVDRHIVAFDERGPGVLECKAPGERMFRKIKAEGPPYAYICQLQWYLYITGWKWGAYAFFHFDTWQLIHFDRERDDELIALMEKAALDYLRMLENGPEPERLPPTDPRCGRCEFRHSCQGAALIASVEDSGKDLEIDPDIGGVVQEYIEAKHLENEAGELVAETRARLEAAMNNRHAVETAGARVYWKPQVSKRVDTKLLRQKYPLVASEVERDSVSRPLRVFPI